MYRQPVTITLSSLDYHYLKEALEATSRRPCHRSNCGTVCLCARCAARKVLKALEGSEVTNAASSQAAGTQP